MSIWYQLTVTAFGSTIDIARFFRLKPSDIYIDNFEFSFGNTNFPGLHLNKIIEENDNLVFLIHQLTDYGGSIWIQRFDRSSGQHQLMLIEEYEHGRKSSINKFILDKYAKKFPYLMDQHNNDNRPYEWKWFFDFATIITFLKYFDKNLEMISPITAEDLMEDDFFDLSELK